MRRLQLIPLSAAFAALLAAPSFAATRLHIDHPRMVRGVESACTGVGYSEEHNPRWTAYPLKVVLDGRDGQYLAGENVSLMQDGHTVADVHCNGPWVLFRAQPGDYHVVADIGRSAEAAATDVKTGRQDDVILSFPHRGGAVSAQFLSRRDTTQASG